MAFSALPVPVKQGPLLKEGEWYFWNARHFELWEGGCLKYYTNEAAATAGDLRGSMMLSNAMLTNVKTPRKGRYAFRIDGAGSSTSRRAQTEVKFVLAGETLSITLEWVAALERAGVRSTFDRSLVVTTSADRRELREWQEQQASRSGVQRSTDKGLQAQAVPAATEEQAATLAAPMLEKGPASAAPPSSFLDQLTAALNRCLRCAPTPGA